MGKSKGVCRNQLRGLIRANVITDYSEYPIILAVGNASKIRKNRPRRTNIWPPEEEKITSNTKRYKKLGKLQLALFSFQLNLSTVCAEISSVLVTLHTTEVTATFTWKDFP